jgi:hypothetical protein
MSTQPSLCPSLLLTLTALLNSTLAAAATFSVTNYGMDSSTCGSSAHPCRSISQAIENASDHDTIWVGAGHYGDLNGDGNFADPGDEHATADCVICVTKSLHIYSFNGAAVTIIDSGPSGGSPATVRLTADGTIFGAVGHGFTITGGNTIGVLVDRALAVALTADIVVAGNIDLKDGTGFVINGLGEPLPRCPPEFPQQCTFKPNAQVLLQGNQAIGSGIGFSAIQNYDPPDHIKFVMQGNLALGTGSGFVAHGGHAEYLCPPFETCFSAPVATYLNNVAVDGDVGFSLPYTGPVKGNTASRNSQAGFLLETTGTVFTQNSAIGNAGPGVIVAPGGGKPEVTDQFYGNNFFGNDRNRPQIIISDGGLNIPLGPSKHCGVVNVGAILFLEQPGPPPVPPQPPLPETLQAPNNFWGSASGPQQNGQGDAAGGVCDFNGGITIAKPVLTGPTAITSFQ